MKKDLNIQFEKAVRLLVKHVPVSDENSRKPILFHDIRVGTYLYENGYGENVVLAGVLHDAIEWSDITEGMLITRIPRFIIEFNKDETKKLIKIKEEYYKQVNLKK